MSRSVTLEAKTECRPVHGLIARRIVSEENDEPDIDVTGLRKVYDWVEQDAGKTVLMSGIQTVGAKAWE